MIKCPFCEKTMYAKLQLSGDFATSCTCAFRGPMAPTRPESRQRLSRWLKFIEATQHDVEEAAGEFLIDVPRPGTTIAVLLHANVMLRKYRVPELERRIAELTDARDKLVASLARCVMGEAP